VWGTSDQFRYVYQAFTGDIDIISRVVSLENTHAVAKAGVMIRETLAANAVQTSLVVTPGIGTRFYRRLTVGGVTLAAAAGTAAAGALHSRARPF
jgi:predicted Fe-Mo cluster-binding NifX family protein